MRTDMQPILNVPLPIFTTTNKFIRNYRVIAVLKATPQDRVLLAIYFKHLWFKRCILKESTLALKTNPEIDRYKRLTWEYTLHQKFLTTLPIAKSIDFFEIEDKVYLVLEYVSGTSLQEVIDKLYGGFSFKSLALSNKQKLIDLLLQVIEIIQKVHRLGYIHRDISGSNFMLAKTGSLFLLDMELTARQSDSVQSSAFFPGWTKGYSSPQQIRNESPTIYDDIYSIGCLAINVLTHTHPRTLDLLNLKKVAKALAVNIVYPDMLDLIIRCLDPYPLKRPGLNIIVDGLNQYKTQSNSVGTESP